MPAQPGAGPVVIEAEFVVGGLRAVLDHPAVALDPGQRFDRCASGTPRRDERRVVAANATADQETARARTRPTFVAPAGIEVGEFQIGPIIAPLALGAAAGRRALPGGRFEVVGDRGRGARDCDPATPGVELAAAGAHAKHSALARPAKRHLDPADARPAVSRHPSERHTCFDSSRDHRQRQRRRGRKACIRRHMRGHHAGGIARPPLWQVERPVMKAWPWRET